MILILQKGALFTTLQNINVIKFIVYEIELGKCNNVDIKRDT